MRFILWVALITANGTSTSQQAALFDTYEACHNALDILKADIETPGGLSNPRIVVKGSCLPVSK